jgi:hypothetical protein
MADWLKERDGKVSCSVSQGKLAQQASLSERCVTVTLMALDGKWFTREKRGRRYFYTPRIPERGSGVIPERGSGIGDEIPDLDDSNTRTSAHENPNEDQVSATLLTLPNTPEGETTPAPDGRVLDVDRLGKKCIHTDQLGNLDCNQPRHRQGYCKEHLGKVAA